MNIASSVEVGLSVVVPVYSRFDDIDLLLNSIVCELPRIKTALKIGVEIEIIFVDDGGNESLTESHFSNFVVPDDFVIRIIRLSRNFGQHEALLCGYMESKGSIVVRLNSDNENLCRYIPEIIEILNARDVDRCILTGSKQVPVSSQFMNRIENQILNIKSNDNDMPVRGYSRRFVDVIIGASSSSNYTIELEDWIGFETFRLHMSEALNSRTLSSYNFRKRLNLAFSVIALRSTKTFQNLSIFTFGVVTVSLLLALLLVFLALFRGLGGTGFVTLALMQIFFSSTILVVLSTVGVLASKVLTEAQKRPPFVIENSFEIKKTI